MKIFIFLCGCLFAIPAVADNPIVPGMGQTDPHVPIFGGRAYVYASGAADGATIEVCEGGTGGKRLGTCTVPATGGWNQYQTILCPLKNAAGTTSLCLVFKGGKEELVRLNWWKVCQ